MLISMARTGWSLKNLLFFFWWVFYFGGLKWGDCWPPGGVFSALVKNSIPGTVGTDPTNIKNSIYSIKKNDPDFGTSWQQYRFAVQTGADFYDGNNDGIYNPVDLNSNGRWDVNEDKPDMFGDETVWCIFN